MVMLHLQPCWTAVLGLCVHAATGLPYNAPPSTPMVCDPLNGAASRAQWGTHIPPLTGVNRCLPFLACSICVVMPA